jgi:DNA mismatch repair ATPase MutL
LDEGLRLGDLTDEQRRIVTDLIAEYRPAYETLCEQMVSHTSTQPNINRAFGWEGEEWQKMQEQQEVMEKMRFDRNELNQRAVASLKAALTEDQIKRIGGLPEPDDDEGFGMWK